MKVMFIPRVIIKINYILSGYPSFPIIEKNIRN